MFYKENAVCMCNLYKRGITKNAPASLQSDDTGAICQTLFVEGRNRGDYLHFLDIFRLQLEFVMDRNGLCGTP